MPGIMSTLSAEVAPNTRKGNMIKLKKEVAPTLRSGSHPHVGFGDGLVRLVVQTHNNQGIAKGTEICINAGPDFSARHDLANCFQGASEKKFRGALDALFEKQLTVQEPEGENQCLAPPLAGAEGFAGGKQIDGQSEVVQPRSGGE